MRQRDYVDVLAHLRMRMQESGLAEVDAEIMASLHEEPFPPLYLLLGYIEDLRTHLRLRSRAAVGAATERLGGHLEPTAEPFAGSRSCRPNQIVCSTVATP